jgi:hypothetical protein
LWLTLKNVRFEIDIESEDDKINLDNELISMNFRLNFSLDFSLNIDWIVHPNSGHPWQLNLFNMLLKTSNGCKRLGTFRMTTLTYKSPINSCLHSENPINVSYLDFSLALSIVMISLSHSRKLQITIGTGRHDNKAKLEYEMIVVRD